MNLKTRLTLMMILLLNISLFAQDGYELSGTVSDADNIPIPGVNVIITNTTRGTATDFDGLYQLEVNSGEELQFSYLGYVTQTVAITGQTELNITMAEDASQLEEVVVVGYGSQKKGDLTGAISTIKSDDINKVQTTNLGQAIQGKVAGVQVTQGTGRPGSGATIKIRGVGSILSGNGPLVLVNGFQGSLDDVDADNVESMTILKDAAAASIYGSRAANGVILVTTKKGRPGQLNITFKTEAGFQSITKQPDYLNATDWASRQNEGRIVQGNTPFWTADTATPESFGEGTDWADYVFRNGFVQDTHLGITGGTETTKYALGVGYVQQQGTVIGTEFDRINIRLDIEQKLGKRIVIGANLSANRSKYNETLDIYTNGGRGALNLISGGPPTLPEDIDGRVAFPSFAGEQFSIERNISPALASKIQNNEEKINSAAANVFVEAEIFNGLKYKLGLNASTSNSYEKDFTKFFQVFSATDPTEVALTSSPANLILEGTLRENWEIQNTLTYNKIFGNHNVTALLGYSAQKNNTNTTGADGSGLPSNDIQQLSAAETMNSIDSSFEEFSLASLFARLNYAYDSKYLFQANVRRDGTSVFAPGKQYATFPSFSVGWRVSNEDFLINNDFISNLKLRYGYGSLGNSQIPLFKWIPLITVTETTALGASQGSVPAYSIKDLVNEDVQWETTTTSDFGVDLGLLNGKVNLVADIYTKKTEDMLLFVPIAPSSGFINGPILNIGEVQNKGWEVLLSYNDTFGDFNFGASFNISRITNEVIDLGGTEAFTDGSVRIEEGRTLFAYWGFQTDGIWQTTDEIDANASRSGVRPGQLRYKDINGFDAEGNLTGTPDGAIDDADKTEIGSNIADFVYGFSLNAEYKNFDLSVFFQGESNKDIAIVPVFGGLGGGLDQEKAINNNTDQYFYDNRTILGADGNVSVQGTVPAVGLTPFEGEWSEYNIQDVSYLRIRNIQLGYSLPKRTVDKLGISSLRLYLNLTNPVLWTDYIGYDPEFQGFDDGGLTSLGFTSRGGLDAYPQAKTTALGIKVSF